MPAPEPTDTRVLIPRVRRALGPTTLDDGQVNGLIADCVATLILLTDGDFPYQLIVTDRDDAYGAASEWEVVPELGEPEQVLVAMQAALSWYMETLASSKTSETIKDEGQEWSFTISATAVKSRLDHLISERDRALDVLLQAGTVPAVYASFLEVRDREVSALLEPWVVA